MRRALESGFVAGLLLLGPARAAGPPADPQQSPEELQLLSVVERVPSARALLELARLEARRGEQQKALEHLRRARELAPNSEEILSAYARVALAVEAPVEAIRTLEGLTRMHPSVATYHYLLGVARFQIAESAGAAEALERALELEPRNGLAQIALGLVFRAQRRLPEAKEVLVRSLQLMPGNVDALVALAEAEIGLGDLEAAERNAQRALELAPKAPAALFVIGKIRMQQRDYAAARDLLLESAERNPGAAKTLYQLSLAYSRLGDRESSAKYLKEYREALAAEEKRLSDLLTAAGMGVSGMRGLGG